MNFWLARYVIFGLEVIVPMEGLRLGEQLSWLGRHKLAHANPRKTEKPGKVEVPTRPRDGGRMALVSRFYALLDQLSARTGGPRTLVGLKEHRDWPRRGIYFFFEPSECRSDSGEGPRVVRIGTHALKANAKSTLVQRLGQHRGSESGDGNHRGSIFRLLIGQSILARDGSNRCPTWGVKGDKGKACLSLGIDRDALDAAEAPVERAVSSHIRSMPFVWLGINDEPGPDSQRAIIERNAIALLSNLDGASIDPPSADWLGHHSNRELVRRSGLWNQRHVTEAYDASFLDVLESLVG